MNIKQLNISLDIDEVLLPLLPLFLDWYNKRVERNFHLSQFVTYNWETVLGTTKVEVISLFFEFIYSEFYRKNCQAITGAKIAVTQLKEMGFKLFVNTARQNELYDITKTQLTEKFGGNKTFKDICLGNKYARDNTEPTVEKLDICLKHNIQLAIDDSPNDALRMAEFGIKVLLFNYKDQYPWTILDKTHPNITIVYDWDHAMQEVQRLTETTF